MQRVGTCSLCGGDVYGHRGAWMGGDSPRPDTCGNCGAVRGEDIIPMKRPSDTLRELRAIAENVKNVAESQRYEQPWIIKKDLLNDNVL